VGKGHLFGFTGRVTKKNLKASKRSMLVGGGTLHRNMEGQAAVPGGGGASMRCIALRFALGAG